MPSSDLKMKRQTVYIVDISRPWHDVQAVEFCELRQGDKFTWAITPRGRRRLLGSSAFFMASTAERRRIDLLRGIVMNTYISFHQPGKWEMAKRAYDKIYGVGVRR